VANAKPQIVTPVTCFSIVSQINPFNVENLRKFSSNRINARQHVKRVVNSPTVKLYKTLQAHNVNILNNLRTLIYYWKEGTTVEAFVDVVLIYRSSARFGEL